MYTTSISTTFNYDIPLEKQIQMIKNAGFTHISFGMNYEHSNLLNEEGCYKLKEYLKLYGLLVDTIHGYDLDKVDSIEINEKVARAAMILDAPIVVVHCSDFWFSDEKYTEKLNVVKRHIKPLEKIAKKYNIRFAFENVVPGISTDLCEAILEITNPDYFGFCYDSSHDQIDGPNSMDLLNRQLDRLIAVHLSDRIKEFVDHVIPGEGFIYFDEIIPLLQKAKYHSPVLMEVEMTHSMYKNTEEFLEKTNEAALKIAKLLN